jgi:hypothetical protein
VNDWIVMLTSSKVILIAIFFLCAVASVTGLEAIRARMARVQRENGGSDTGPITKTVAVAAIVFVLVFATGGSGLFLAGRTFLNVTLTMFGIADLLVLSLLTWQFRSGLPLADAELRRIAARDL